nr:carbohydrate-binding protein [uncultured Olsenella sp.]
MEPTIADAGDGWARIAWDDGIATYYKGTTEEAARAAPALHDRERWKRERPAALAAAVERMAVTSAQSLADEEAVNVAVLFPEWDGGGIQYRRGDRLCRYGTLYKVLQDHVSQPDWAPEDSPSLFAEVLCAPGEEPKPFRVVPGGEGYMTGETCTDGGRTWRSRIDHNVWAPSTSPQFWERLD